MKYRVKFPCYHYNTGAGDNCHYISNREFNTLEQAKAFKQRVDKQVIVFSDDSKTWVENCDNWRNSENFIEIEDGYITGNAIIVGFEPEKEINL